MSAYSSPSQRSTLHSTSSHTNRCATLEVQSLDLQQASDRQAEETRQALTNELGSEVAQIQASIQDLDRLVLEFGTVCQTLIL